jgi:hypothetical protein
MRIKDIPLLVPDVAGIITGFVRVDAVDSRTLTRVCSSTTVRVEPARVSGESGASHALRVVLVRVFDLGKSVWDAVSAFFKPR